MTLKKRSPKRCRICHAVPSDPVPLRPDATVCKSCLNELEVLVSRIDDDVSRLQSRNTSWHIASIVVSILVGFIFLGSFHIGAAALLSAAIYGLVLSPIAKVPVSNNDAAIKKLLAKRQSTVVSLRDLYALHWPLPPDWFWRREQVQDRDGHKCQECGRRMHCSRVPFHIHHIIPKKHPDGDHALKNLVLLCEICHSKQPGHELVENSRKQRLARLKKNHD